MEVRRARYLSISALLLVLIVVVSAFQAPEPSRFERRRPPGATSPPADSRAGSKTPPAQPDPEPDAVAPRRIAPGHEASIASLLRDPDDQLQAHQIRNMRAVGDTILVEIVGPTPGTLILSGAPLDRPILATTRSFFLYWDGPSEAPADVDTLVRGIAARDVGHFWERVAPRESPRLADSREPTTDLLRKLQVVAIAVAAAALITAGLLRLAASRQRDARRRLLRWRWAAMLLPTAAGVHAVHRIAASALPMRLDLLGAFPVGAGFWLIAVIPGAATLLLACLVSTSDVVDGAADARCRRLQAPIRAFIAAPIGGIAMLAIALAPLALPEWIGRGSGPAVIRFLAYVLFHWVVIFTLWKASAAGRLVYAPMAALGVFHFVASLFLEPLQLGDSLELKHATFAELPRSELLASAFHAGVREIVGSLYYSAPIAGALTIAAVFAVGRLAERRYANRGSLPYLLTACYVASPLSFLFAGGYVENAQLAIAPAMLGMALLCQYSRDDASRWSLLGGLALLCLAGLTHGWGVFLWSAIILVPLSALAFGSRDWAPRAFEMIVGVGVMFGIAQLATVGLAGLGFGFKTGNLFGGSDGCALLNLHPGACWDQRHPLVSWGHVREWLRPAVLAFPPWLVVAVLQLRRGPIDPRPMLVVGSALVAYLGFLFLWNFDLGYPGDFDLMFSGAATLVVFTAQVLAAFAGQNAIGWPTRVLLLGSCLVSGAITVPPLLAAAGTQWIPG